MTERLTLIITLELAIARGSAERRAKMALQITDLFAHATSRLSENILALFDEIITRLAHDIDVSTLATITATGTDKKLPYQYHAIASKLR